MTSIINHNNNNHTSYIYGAIKGKQCLLTTVTTTTSNSNNKKQRYIHDIKPACIIYNLNNGKITKIIVNNLTSSSSLSTNKYENEINKYFNEDIKNQIDLSKYPYIYNNDDDIIIPGLIDINNTICDVELGLNKNTLENICKSAITGGVTTMVDLPKTNTNTNFQQYCLQIEETLKTIHPIYNVIDIIPFAPLLSSSSSTTTATTTNSNTNDNTNNKKPIGLYASMIHIGHNNMANTIEDIQEYLKQDESEQKSPILFIHGEMCSDKNLRIASPHRLLPCNTRYDPTFELKDHPSHLLGPVSQGSSSNPGGAFNENSSSNTPNPSPNKEQSFYLSNNNNNNNSFNETTTMMTTAQLTMSPTVQALEHRRSVSVHHDWNKPIETFTLPSSSTTLYTTKKKSPTNMVRSRSLENLQKLTRFKQSNNTNMATTTTNTTTKSISIPNNNNIGNTKTTKKTFYSTLLNSELQSYKYNTDQSNKKEEKKKNTISNTNVKKNIPTRARRNSPFQMKINTNNGNNKSRFKSLSISTSSNKSNSNSSNNNNTVVPSPANSNTSNTSNTSNGSSNLKYHSYSPPKALILNQQKSSLLQRRANFSLTPTTTSTTTTTTTSNNKQKSTNSANKTNHTTNGNTTTGDEDDDQERYSVELEIYNNNKAFLNKFNDAKHIAKRQGSPPISIPSNSPPSQSPPNLYNGNKTSNSNTTNSNVFDKDNNGGIIKIYKMPDPLTKAAIAANYDV